MNNREAITLLRNLEDSLDSYCELNEEGKTAFRMAIEALNCSEIPNNSDTISRQAAIETVRKAKDKSEAHRMLLQLPPAQPGWIPWDSGGFPEESGTYTVTAYDGATKRVTYAKYQKRLKRWELTGSRAYWKVLAWQPLPTPYREGGQS